MPVLIQAAARLSLATLALLSVLACSAPAPEPQDEDEARALGRDTDETVFDDMIQTQDKARGVEDLTLGRKDELDQALEASEGETSREE
ncbi:MAG TPA: hypothetical protein VFP48_04730 [Steroidobacteraceae bacterium]|nr:hypothetical protein [Steroidobacteraceae bacterium]